MSNKDLKTRTPISNSVEKEIWKEFKEYSEKTGIPLSKLLDKSISLFLKSTKK
ncbi:ribbon-helix-helix domain-containing protein [Clostridium butyricum]|uniref:ribbon-helix-helix domain-containing protein n=1 Tax=Clostridium butyricum TaxID=1492 RepID=UPI0009038DA9|nr:ribbon-helix-helix domain-containing protein [Clostridium butyricum]APF21432.1 ribbon-helix-helix domain protein [Clostridium butyricum]